MFYLFVRKLFEPDFNEVKPQPVEEAVPPVPSALEEKEIRMPALSSSGHGLSSDESYSPCFTPTNRLIQDVSESVPQNAKKSA